MAASLGNVFGDEILSGRILQFNRIPVKDRSPDGKGRVWIFIVICIFGFGILTARLFFLTIIDGSRYRKLAQGNRIRETPIYAPRGIVYDRNGKALVRNIPVFTTVKGEVYFEDKPASLSGVLIEKVTREYLYHDALSHVLGYTGEATKEDISNTNVKNGTLIGKMGLEQSYDPRLRGRDGKEMYEVDALGNRIRTLGRVEPVAGENLITSLDVELQQVARDEMVGKKGAVVAANPMTGEILALYSAPSFDPNAFIQGKDLEPIFSSSDQPLFDRAIGGTYPPGSPFKIVTALAGLESGAITSQTQVEDTGVLTVGNYSFGNWYYREYGKKDGIVDLVSAIKRSNDIYFYKAGEATGIDTLAKWARAVGVERQLGIDIQGEAKGLMPDPQWTTRVKKEQWYLGNTYHVSIGQGDVLVTPLQMNAWTNVIANGGKLCTPHLLKNGKTIRDCKDLGIKREYLTLIQRGMEEACQTGGTGWPLFHFKVLNEKLKIDDLDFLPSAESTTSGKKYVEVATACKTGTAEFGDLKSTHAWFTIFAPANHPTISITVLKEGAGEGSTEAAPVAKKMLENWFGR